MQDKEIDALVVGIAALEGQRATLGDAVVDLALRPLRAQLASLQRQGGVKLRQLTVLFADVVGSTAMVSAMHSEDAMAILNGVLRSMAAAIEAHHGRVLRFTGDGLKAAFGVDETREDDAERAVRAGLAILQAGRTQAEVARVEHGIADLAVRVGVHTGDVALGAGVEVVDTAMGVAVHIAARMEQSAPPNALRISHDTWNQVRGLFEFEPQPPLAVKGIAAPMRTYLVLGALDRHAASIERGLQGLHTRTVGRDAELQRLLDAVEQVRTRRELRALTVVGDPGLGKSRLLRELADNLSRDGSDCRMLVVRSQPDGMLHPFGLLRSLLALQCGVADTDSAEIARRKVEEGLAPWFAEHGARQAQLIGQLSGLDFGDSPHLRGLDPRSLRDRALAALRAWLQGFAGGGALPVLLCEDLHWADDESLDLLQDLVAHAEELPMALLMTGRPALLTRRPDWGLPDARVVLDVLTPAQADELAHALLHRISEVPPKLFEIVVGRGEGNPYYMEELVRRLVDDGVIGDEGARWTVDARRLDALRLPVTLVGLLQARLDALAAEERAAARNASVIGHVFWDDAVRAIDDDAPAAMPALERSAIVKPRTGSAFEGTPERQFDHHLLHQVTYDTLLKAERHRGHGAVARWLAARTQGRSGEFLAMTGDHAQRAGETALAIDCFEQAAAEAQKRFANASATDWLRRALVLLGEAEPARRFELLRRLESVSDIMGDRPGQDAVHADMMVLLDRHPDDAKRSNLLLRMGLLASRRSDDARAESLCREAADLAGRCGAAKTAAVAFGYLASRLSARRDLDGAWALYEKALQWAGRIDDEATRIEAECQLQVAQSSTLRNRGQVKEAQAKLLAVVQRAQAGGLRRIELVAASAHAIAAADRGDWQDAVTWAEHARSLAGIMGSPMYVARSCRVLSLAAAARGDLPAAIAHGEQALESSRACGAHLMEAEVLLDFAGRWLERGDAPGALEWLIQVRAALRQPQENLLLASRAAALGALCEFRSGRPDSAQALLEDALRHLDGALRRLEGEWSLSRLEELIPARWACHQALASLGDARADALLEQLFADVWTYATTMSEGADPELLIQAIPELRRIAAARRGH